MVIRDQHPSLGMICPGNPHQRNPNAPKFEGDISKDIVDNYRTMFESRISAGSNGKLPFPQNLHISSWSYDMEGHAKNCVERFCELANKTTQQLYKVSTPCIDDHHYKEEELKSVGEIVKSMLSNGSEMLIFGKNWTT